MKFAQVLERNIIKNRQGIITMSLLISLWNRCSSLFQQSSIAFIQGCFVSSLIEMVILEIFRSPHSIFNLLPLALLGKNVVLHLKKNLASTLPKPVRFESSLVEIGLRVKFGWNWLKELKRPFSYTNINSFHQEMFCVWLKLTQWFCRKR